MQKFWNWRRRSSHSSTSTTITSTSNNSEKTTERTHRSVKFDERAKEANSRKQTHPMHTVKFANWFKVYRVFRCSSLINHWNVYPCPDFMHVQFSIRERMKLANEKIERHMKKELLTKIFSISIDYKFWIGESCKKNQSCHPSVKCWKRICCKLHELTWIKYILT